MSIRHFGRRIIGLSSPFPLVFALVVSTGTTRQQPIHENMGARVSLDSQQALPPAPMPRSLRLRGAFQEGGNVHTLPRVSPQEIAGVEKAAGEKFAGIRPGPLRAGFVRRVGRVPLTLETDSASVTVDGEKVWTLAVRSPGALGLRVHFTNFDVGAGSALVYAREGDGAIVRGPYGAKGPNQTGDFWTASLPGDIVFVEIAGSDQPRIEVAEIIHFDKSPGGQEQGVTNAPQELSCHLDVMCEDVDALARDATVAIGFTPVKSDGAFFCSGTILNDLDGETTVPYLLTANHCGITPANVSSIEVVYFYQRSSCGGPLPNFMTLPRSIGGAVVASNGGNDMTFIRLNGELPGGGALAGWSTATSTGSYGIHHPDGKWKRASFVSDVGFCPSCLCRDPTDYDYYDQDRGIVESGSSGSGVFDTSGRLVGQLWGTCCVSLTGCPAEGCGSAGSYWTIYGEFETTYPIIKRWLEIGGTIHVDRSYSGTELGTPSQPFRTITAAHSFAWNGARIKIKAGLYPEAPILSKQVTIVPDGGIVTIGF